MTRGDTAGRLLETLRRDEQQRTWLNHLETLGPPPFAIELAGDEEAAASLRELDVPEEDIPAILASRPDPDRDPDAWWVLERSVHQLVAAMGSFDSLPGFPSPYTVPGMNRFFFVHVFLATLPHTRRYHQEHGIPAAVARATLADLGRNIRVNRKRRGEGGLEVAHWLMLHFRGMIYQLGRLQFERSRTWEPVVASIRAHDGSASPDDLALSIHIPDFMGPMTPDACDASIAWARAFFPVHFPDEALRWGICGSWLLDPHLRDYLAPGSNIIRFQDRFVVGDADENADASVLRFVFGVAPDDLDELPQESSLQRAIVTHLRNGGHWQFRPGWFAWNYSNAIGGSQLPRARPGNR